MLEFEGKVLSGWVNIARFLAEKYGKWKSSSLLRAVYKYIYIYYINFFAPKCA